MKLTIETKQLKDALGRVSSLPGSADTLYFSTVLYLDAGMDGLVVERMTHTAKASITVEASILEEGPAVVSYAKLVAVLGRMSDKVAMESDGKMLAVTSGPAVAKLPIIADPEIESAKEQSAEKPTKGIKIDVEDLTRILHDCQMAAGRESGRPQLIAVGIKPGGGSATFTGADGRRFHCHTRKVKVAEEVAIPIDGVTALLRFAHSSTGAAKLGFTGTRAFLAIKDDMISVSLAEALLPGMNIFTSTKPEEAVARIMLGRDELLSAIRAAASLGDDKKVLLVSYEERLEVRSDDSTGASFSQPIKSKSKWPGEILVNGKFMEEALGVLAGDSIELLYFEAKKNGHNSVQFREEDRMVVVAPFHNTPK